MKTPSRFVVRTLTCLVVAALGHGASFAQTFSSAGAAGTLTVEYVFVSAGKKADINDSREWKVSRTVSLQAELAAEPPASAPTLGPMDPAIMADNAKLAQRGAAVARNMQPLMDDVQKILAKCGDNEACIERETVKLGMATKMTPQMEANRKEVADISKAPVNRFQRWRAQSLKGSYSIDESFKSVLADPICTHHPQLRCSRTETRKGAGAVPPPQIAAKEDPRAAAGLSGIEVDTAKNTFTVLLPLPMTMLPVEETIATDQPEHKKENGKRSKQLNPGLLGFKPITQPITVALKGSARNQSGTQVFDMTDPAGNAGKLTARWSFVAR